MNILDEIVRSKKRELSSLKKRIPLKKIEDQLRKKKNTASFYNAISAPQKLTIIAEMKKKSPSAGMILKSYSPSKMADLYAKCGAGALSVLTEKRYFGGCAEDLVEARRRNALPVLRKDFIIDPYQVYETKALGASALLLIIAILKPKEYSSLFGLARDLGMDVLVEVHSEKELETALRENPKIIGINNRNLKTLKTDIETTFRLISKAPDDICVVSESGITSADTIRRLRTAGVRGALVGESILKAGDMVQQLKTLVQAGEE